ncbi:MAG: RNA polymerase factor sigma-54 [Proteobacteria bacterium]|nr:RNA polymerase factor sigma-54 [Pseudomonadota bacterium]MBU1905243.1 RNA polymerase factor sigma-54 [Pseudomonadota bacterium]
MALELRQSLGLSQHLVMTPQLQQAIKLLQLSRLELLETISQEIDENPLLDELTTGEVEQDEGEDEREATSGQEPPELPEVKVEERIRDDVDWEAYITEYNTGWAETRYEERDTPTFENITDTKTNLSTHLIWQLNMSNVDEKQKEIGVHIIGNLDEDGYLDIPLEEISQATGHPFEKVLETLQLIQNFDPVGVAARDLQECLLIQTRFLNLGGTIVEKMILDHLKALEEKKYDKIASSLSLPIQDVISAVSLIQGLDPRPGRVYSNDETIYITPDIYVLKVGDDYEIVQNEDGLPKLRINGYYKRILQNKSPLSEDTKAYIQEKLRSAAWLIKSIHQRQRTLFRVTESIVRFQREFLDKGITHLKPLVLRNVAEDIEMHESTVSRVTTNKYVYTPQGLFELKFFFNSSISRLDGEALASESVKEQIRKVIKNEDKAKPYSDKEIEKMMKRLNINIARRTVAKYRESMGILPSRKRKDFLLQ